MLPIFADPMAQLNRSLKRKNPSQTNVQAVMFFHVKNPASTTRMFKEMGEELFQDMQLTPLDCIFSKIYWIRLCGAGFKFLETFWVKDEMAASFNIVAKSS